MHATEPNDRVRTTGWWGLTLGMLFLVTVGVTPGAWGQAPTPAGRPNGDGPSEVAVEDGQPLPTSPTEKPAQVMILAKNKSIEEILADIREQTGVRVEALGEVKGTQIQELRLREVPVEKALEQIATSNKWIWVKQDEGSYQLMDKQTYQNVVLAERAIRVTFQLKYVDAEEMNKIVESVLTKDIGSSAADARTNKLIVTDLPDKIALIESIINEYDVQLYTHIFEIEHANVEQVAERLGEIKSKSAEIYVEPDNRLIIVKDTFEKIREMEQLVAVLDRDLEMRVYNLVNIGIDAQDAEDLIADFIEPIITEGAVLNFNRPSSKLFVRDIRPVHEKILNILKQLDQPKKQVMIEGELLSVAMDNTLELGTQFEYNTHGISTGGDEPGLVKTNVTDLITGGGGLSAAHLTDNLSAQLSAFLSDKDTRLLLRPRLNIANHEVGSFEVTKNEPVLTTFRYTNRLDDGSTPDSSTQRTIPSGLIVEITPHISNRGLVELEVLFENSQSFVVPPEQFGSNQRGVGTTAERATTVLLIPDGQTSVIGGLIRRDRSDESRGIPYLSQIPYMGFLFGNKTKTDQSRNLMFFLTPTIMDSAPSNDLIVEAVNEEARQSMAMLEERPTPPEDLGDIPEELKPYLEEVRPKAAPYTDEATTPTTRTAPLDEAALQRGRQLLSDQPYPRGGLDDQGRKIGGAVQLLGDARGPSGVFGAQERPVYTPSEPEPEPERERRRPSRGRERRASSPPERPASAEAERPRRSEPSPEPTAEPPAPTPTPTPPAPAQPTPDASAPSGN